MLRVAVIRGAWVQLVFFGSIFFREEDGHLMENYVVADSIKELKYVRRVGTEMTNVLSVFPPF